MLPSLCEMNVLLHMINGESPSQDPRTRMNLCRPRDEADRRSHRSTVRLGQADTDDQELVWGRHVEGSQSRAGADILEPLLQ